ncbi:hypothetical protein GGR57DRAFT_470787 [Xylariaceae sp. FL1272]|nr:hypothetical protein GGR57DRAFT_470787 [Xylariaceae sp. FL1272]
MTAKTYSTERPQGKEHFVLYPKRFIILRIVQLVLGVIVLGLTAYSLAVFPVSGAALGIFTAIVTLISSIYILVAHYGPPRAYNYWAILGLDIFLVLFWLISFAVLASQAAAVLSVASYYDGDYVAISNTFGGILAAAAGIGALLWVFYVATLVLHSIGLHRHRKAGLHAMPGKAATNPEGGVAAGVPAGGEKVEMQPQQPEQAQQPQTYYANQAVSSQQSYVSPQQGYATHEQQGYPQQQQQQQPYYPQSSPSPSPIASQPTGSSYVGYQQTQPQHGDQQPQELFNTHPTTVHEAPTNQH